MNSTGWELFTNKLYIAYQNLCIFSDSEWFVMRISLPHQILLLLKHNRQVIKTYKILTLSISSSGSFWLRSSEISLSRKCRNHPRVSRSKIATRTGRARLMISRLNNRKSSSTPCSYYKTLFVVRDAEEDQKRDGWMTCLRTWERWE
jgi:hypothetical protein